MSTFQSIRDSAPREGVRVLTGLIADDLSCCTPSRSILSTQIRPLSMSLTTESTVVPYRSPSTWCVVSFKVVGRRFFGIKAFVISKRI
jgi:hypothetical protein